eukprot:194953-Alexandrium_andersonii.AAC.1
MAPEVLFGGVRGGGSPPGQEGREAAESCLKLLQALQALEAVFTLSCAPLGAARTRAVPTVVNHATPMFGRMRAAFSSRKAEWI